MHDIQANNSHAKLLSKSYSFDQTKALWSRLGYQSIRYSDGDEIETSIGNIISSAKDLSVLSPELRKHCTDWAHLYHLSSSRANVLRPFRTAIKGSILEIGAGCGAITRFLGECGAEVLALEGSLRRAGVARSRTRDLANVTVLAERFSDFELDHKFDVVTLIGVLEYANLFTDADDAPMVMLQKVRKLLKPEGRLIIAIENQLGLKYFAGANEDHVGKPMYGIEDRYTHKTVRTFGLSELTNLLNQAGFPVTDFLACFPDYKLPASIITKKGLETKTFDASALASQSVAKDALKPEFHCFSPELAWPSIIRNGLGMDLANSFLISASEVQDAKAPQGVLAYHYSSERRPLFSKETVFRLTAPGIVKLHYKSLSEGHEKLDATATFDGSLLRFMVPDSADYVAGRTLSQDFVGLVTKPGWSHEDLKYYLKSYLTALGQFAGAKEELHLDSQVSGRYMDCLPTNIIRKDDHALEFIDTEWTMAGEISVTWLLFRAILSLISLPSEFAKDEFGKIYSYQEFFILCFGLLGAQLNPLSLMSLFEKESRLQDTVAGSLNDQEKIKLFLNKPMPHGKYPVVTPIYRDELRRVSSELNAITTSRKWRIAVKISSLTPTFLKVAMRKLIPARASGIRNFLFF